MKTRHGHPIRILAALLALVIAFFAAAVGVASAATGGSGDDDAIMVGANEPTTTVVVDGTPIELIPAASSELPPETSAAVNSSGASGIEVKGVSATGGPTSAAGVDAPMSKVWIGVGAVVILGAAGIVTVRLRKAARR